ncbi:MAG: tetratricopeptide repeat protein [Pirellulaceae bacterium]
MSTDYHQADSRSRQWALAIGILAVTLVAYLPATGCGYIWDDDDYVLENRTLRSAAGLQRIWCEIGATPQYYPMVHTSYWIEYHIWGLHPTGYHLVNILLHAFNAILLWKILRFLQVPGAFLAGLLFALHPVHVESVAWITERKNTLSGCFYLLSAWCYLRCMLAPDGQKHVGKLYALSLLLFIAALLSKSVTATLPAALLLILTWKRRRFEWEDVTPLVPMLAAAIPMAMITSWVEKNLVGTMYLNWDLSVVDRCLIAGHATWFYAGKLLLPLQLTFIYPRWVIDPGIWWQSLFPISALALVGLAWWQRQRLGTGPLVAILFFGGTLVPALGFVDVYPMRFSFVADHFQYLASIGLLTLAAAAFTSWAQRLAGEQNFFSSRTLGPGLLLVVLGVLTWHNCGKYQDLDTLWSDTVNKNPGSQIAHTSLGTLRGDQGRFREARKLLQRAIKLDDEYAEAYNNLAIVDGELGNMQQSYDHIQKAIQLQPGYAKAYFNLAIWFDHQANLPQAQAALEKALSLQPAFPQAHNRLGMVLFRLGKRKESLGHFQEALKLDPEYAEARLNMNRAKNAP